MQGGPQVPKLACFPASSLKRHYFPSPFRALVSRHYSDKHHHLADMVVNIIVISSKPSQLCRSISSSISSSSSSTFQYEIAEPYRQKTITAAVINCAREAELLTETCGVALTGSGCGLSGINCSNAQIIPIFSETSVVSLRGAGFQYKPTFSLPFEL